MSRPVILLDVTYDPEKKFRPYLPAAYMDAVKRAGGIPIMVPYQAEDDIDRVLDLGDGLIMTGGPDVDPAYYDEAKHEKTKLKYEVAQPFDLELARRAHKRDMPVLGVCLGIQQLNVACGGSLYQDIEEQLGTHVIHWHADRTQPRPRHPVRIEPGTRLADVLGQLDIEANSSHHQAVKRVGESLRTVARCPEDNIIEAIEDSNARFFIGVQWHPETLAEPGTVHLRLFEALVSAAKET